MVLHQYPFTRSEATESVTADWPAALRCNDHPNVAERDPIGSGKLDGESEVAPAFLDALANAVGQLKNRLQQRYERAYPGLGDIIRYVIDEEESAAWDLFFPFPHLVLPDMVEAHFAQLGLALANHPDKLAASPIFPETQEHAAQAVGQVYQSLIS